MTRWPFRARIYILLGYFRAVGFFLEESAKHGPNAKTGIILYSRGQQRRWLTATLHAVSDPVSGCLKGLHGVSAGKRVQTATRLQKGGEQRRRNERGHKTPLNPF